ncbi:MAG TPA: hypothetical protein VLA01_03520, partial [Nitrosopumilaceae archaeon]|nr:hypothetical protein [Nitrosopumilaceae archaeon]
MNGQRAILSALVLVISVLLISSTITGVAFAHHKSGHSQGGGNGNGKNNDNDNFDSKAYNKKAKEDRIQRNTEHLKKIKEEHNNKLKNLGNPIKAKELEGKFLEQVTIVNENYEKEKRQILREQLKEIQLTKDPFLIKEFEERHKVELEELEKKHQKELRGLEKKNLNEKIQLLSKEFKEKLRELRKQFRTDKEFQEILR